MKWIGANSPTGDCDGKRLVEKALREHMDNPTVVATLGDSAQYFETKKLRENELKPSLLFCVEIACIAGSANVIEYILKNYKYDLANSQHAIVYASSSGNEELALKITKLSKEQGKKSVEQLFIYAPFSTARKVEKALQEEKSYAPS